MKSCLICNSDTAEGWREAKKAAGAFGGWFGEGISKRPREAMNWPGCFPETRQ